MTQIASLIGNPGAFPILRHWEFFDHAGLAPLPASTAQVFKTYAAQAESGGYLGAPWYQEIEKLRLKAAALIGAHREEIAFIKNTSEGISIVANGIEWQFGDRIVTTAVEYPANVYPWMDVARTRGVKLVMVKEEDQPDGTRAVPIEKLLDAASDIKTKVIALSHVEFASGQRHDLMRIGKFCRERNILFSVDAIQSLGVIPVDVRAMNIDFLAADGHKWLLGPEGAGIFYCRRDLVERIRPLMIGWMNVVDAQHHGNYDLILRSDAGRFECGTYNVAGLLALSASIDLLERVGIADIGARIKGLTTLLAAGVRGKGYRVVSPREQDQWSGILAFTSPQHNHEQIVHRLRKEHKIEIALREGRLRASPHFYNTETQIAKLIDRLPSHFEVG